MTSDNTQPCIYFNTYSPAVRKDRPPRPAHVRDGLPLLLIQPVLAEAGYRPKEIILNLPNARTFVDLSPMRKGDAIVQATRPPGHDRGRERRRVDASLSNLERIIARALGQYFEELRRSLVALAPPYAVLLKEGYEKRARVQFQSQPGCTYQAWKAYGPGDMEEPTDHPTRTAAYFLRTPPLWDEGPDLILLFGISSTETYSWARLLTTTYRDIILSRTPRFVMAELIPSPVPLHPADGSFADEWQADVVCDLPLPLSEELQQLASTRLEDIRGEQRFRA